MRKPRALKSDSGKIGTPDIRTTYQEIDMDEKFKLARSLQQWRNCDPQVMAQQSEGAVAWALTDAKHDVLALGERLGFPEAMTDAARDVLAERRRQIEVEGFTHELDDGYGDGVLSAAAGSYALHAFDRRIAYTPAWWPWIRAWWKPGTPRQMLVKAGALILAAIEQIDRRAAK
ncbi:hypothetical protein [Burkholderia vietnamiensis]|uniref:hypothetical protein n=1 Tax=Burkholderia vietnamiensis TaxID=60552 RepID=UPI0026501DEF|nr:hypothetical protein [Burkholderia vietnamiensis]MDN8068796.1 hypothetical protein [Burkholderia vietnamiensis]